MKNPMIKSGVCNSTLLKNFSNKIDWYENINIANASHQKAHITISDLATEIDRKLFDRSIGERLFLSGLQYEAS